MPTIEINSKPVEVPAGTNLIDAAEHLNIEIPHYCYHPGLSVVGSCRMCQVEIEQNGRRSVVVGCNTIATDGMKVFLDTEEIKARQRSVLEFLLQNHPLDCPICDDAGECDLQNYYMKHGLHESRMELPEKHHKHKVHDVGPSVVLDAERCVLCHRCVRFCREIAGVDQLGILNHGMTSEISNVPGTRLDNDYAGNVVDLCPVGALTDKDFRFKRRVWYLKHAQSICTGCSRGCNIRIDWEYDRNYKDPQRRIQRLKPRYNRMVNEWWMCDHGRYSYHDVDAPTRLTAPRTGVSSNGNAVTVEQVIERAAEKIKTAVAKHGAKSVAVLASARSSNEDLFVLKSLFAEGLKIQNLDVNLSTEAKGKDDEILMRADHAPNRRGALEIGVKPWGGGGMAGDDMIAAALEGDFEVLIVVHHDLTQKLSAKELAKLNQQCGYILYLGTHENGFTTIANDVIPLAMWAERDATYTNFQGRVQRAQAAFAPLGMAVDEWRYWQQLAGALKIPLNFATAEDVFDGIGTSVSSFKGLTWDGLDNAGRMLTGVPEPAYRKVQAANPLPPY
jgi:NADH-quinone oxidoreductase subunit G